MLKSDREAILKRAIERERQARKQAEKLLEDKSSELYESNLKLKQLNSHLNQEIERRTKEIQELAFLTENNPEPVFIIDKNGIAKPSNKPGQLIVPEKINDQLRQELRRIKNESLALLKSKRKGKITVNYGNKYYSLTLVPIANLEIVIVYAKDETESFLASQSIADSEAKYRGMIENLKLGILEVDLNGIITKAYPSFCQLTGYLANELIGKQGEEFLLTHESNKRMKHEHHLRKEGKSSVYEVQIKKKNGELIWVMISGAPIMDRKKGIIGSIGVHLNISDQKETLNRLSLAMEKAEKSRIAEEYFIAQMSHEIRTPLNGIIGMANILAEEIGPNPRIDDLQTSALYLNDLVGKVLDLSSLSSGNFNVKTEAFDLESVNRFITATFSKAAKEQNIAISIEVDQDVPRSYLGDYKAITQILSNLVSNGIKYGKEALTINWSIKQRHLEFDQVQIRITDKGMGIAPEHQDQIFERYQRINNDEEGFGIGLHLSTQLAQILGGQLYLEESSEAGSTFVLELPLMHHEKQELSNKKADLNSNEWLKDKTCFIAEDNEINYQYLNYFLNKMGIQSTRFEEGKSLLKAINEGRRADLYLLDYKMPGMDGITLSKLLRNKSISSPLILLTANAIPEQITEAKNAGIDRVLFKPYAPAKLQALLIELLNSDEKESSIWDKFQQLGGSAEMAQDIFGNDAKYAREMYTQIVDEMEGKIANLNRLHQRKSRSEMGNAIHQFLSSLGMLTLNDLKVRGEEINLSLEKNNADVWDELKAWLMELENLINRLEK